MNTPILLALMTLASGGIVRFFSKVAGVNQAYGPSYMLVQSVCVALVAIVIHIVQRRPIDLSPNMTGMAILGGVIGAIGIFSLLLAFRMGGEGSIIFPIAGLAMIVSVPLSIVLFHEPVTATKLLGLGLGISSIVVLSR